ncbi:outer membrane protein, partial [Helicobacter pylori]
MRRWGFGTS